MNRTDRELPRPEDGTYSFEQAPLVEMFLRWFGVEENAYEKSPGPDA